MDICIWNFNPILAISKAWPKTSWISRQALQSLFARCRYAKLLSSLFIIRLCRSHLPQSSTFCNGVFLSRPCPEIRSRIWGECQIYDFFLNLSRNWKNDPILTCRLVGKRRIRLLYLKLTVPRPLTKNLYLIILVIMLPYVTIMIPNKSWKWNWLSQIGHCHPILDCWINEFLRKRRFKKLFDQMFCCWRMGLDPIPNLKMVNFGDQLHIEVGWFSMAGRWNGIILAMEECSSGLRL